MGVEDFKPQVGRDLSIVDIELELPGGRSICIGFYLNMYDGEWTNRPENFCDTNLYSNGEGVLALSESEAEQVLGSAGLSLVEVKAYLSQQSF